MLSLHRIIGRTLPNNPAGHTCTLTNILNTIQAEHELTCNMGNGNYFDQRDREDVAKELMNKVFNRQQLLNFKSPTLIPAF